MGKSLHARITGKTPIECRCAKGKGNGRPSSRGTLQRYKAKAKKNQKNNNKRSTFDDIECHRQQSLRCIEREKWDSIKNMCKKRAK
jgi:hypothetical protein